VLSLLTTLAVAQQRSPFFATVVGPDGKPLADAEVTCVFTPSLLLPGVRDVVAAKTDARGRARCGSHDRTDAAGKPVVGARAMGNGSSGGDGGDHTQDGQLARVAFDLWSSYAALPSSGPDGVLVMPAFLPPGMDARVIVRAGPRQSEVVGFAADAEQTVVLK